MTILLNIFTFFFKIFLFLPIDPFQELIFSNSEVNQYFTSFAEVMPIVNFFVPFHLLIPMFSGWIVFVFSVFVFKFIFNIFKGFLLK